MLPPEFLERPIYQRNYAEGRIRRFFRFEQWTEIDFNGRTIVVKKAPEFKIDIDGNYGSIRTDQDIELVQIRRPVPEIHTLVFYIGNAGRGAGKGDDIDLAFAYHLGVYDREVARIARANIIPDPVVEFVYQQVA